MIPDLMRQKQLKDAYDNLKKKKTEFDEQFKLDMEVMRKQLRLQNENREIIEKENYDLSLRIKDEENRSRMMEQ